MKTRLLETEYDDKAQKHIDQFPSLRYVKNTLAKSIYHDGDNNDFIIFLKNVANSEPTALENHDEQFGVIERMYDLRKIDLNNPALLNASLYKRPARDIEYIVNAFDTVSNPRKLLRYFTQDKINSLEISTDAFMDGNIIKSKNEIRDIIVGWENSASTDTSTTQLDDDDAYDSFVRNVGINIPQNKVNAFRSWLNSIR